MKIGYQEIIIYILSILVLILFFYFSINHITKKKIEIINFVDSNIHEDFELEITNNLEDINNYLKKYSFIESHLLKYRNNEINIQINLKQSFALNKITSESFSSMFLFFLKTSFAIFSSFFDTTQNKIPLSTKDFQLASDLLKKNVRKACYSL